MTTFEPIQLGGKDIYATVCKWRDNIKIHVRVYHRNHDNKLIPQKRGICLDIDEFTALTKQMSVLRKQIVTLEQEAMPKIDLHVLKETVKGSSTLKRKRKSKTVPVPKRVRLIDEETIVDI